MQSQPYPCTSSYIMSNGIDVNLRNFQGYVLRKVQKGGLDCEQILLLCIASPLK